MHNETKITDGINRRSGGLFAVIIGHCIGFKRDVFNFIFVMECNTINIWYRLSVERNKNFKIEIQNGLLELNE